MKSTSSLQWLRLSVAILVVASAARSSAMDSDAVALSGRDFFKTFQQRDRAEREKALLYLLGVLDATEGKVWCDYRRLKTVTLQEFVFEYFRRLPAARLDDRASRLIEEALSRKFPCGGRS